MKKIILLSLIIVSHAASAVTFSDRNMANIKIRKAQRLAQEIKDTKLYKTLHNATKLDETLRTFTKLYKDFTTYKYLQNFYKT